MTGWLMIMVVSFTFVHRWIKDGRTDDIWLEYAKESSRIQGR